jgi:hypothetical protein
MSIGCISPQFHCIFDDHFQSLLDQTIPSSQWQEKANLRETELTRDESGTELGSKGQPHEGGMEHVENIRRNIQGEPQDDFIPNVEPLV